MFDTTVEMSTYLFAITVAEFEAATANPALFPKPVKVAESLQKMSKTLKMLDILPNCVSTKYFSHMNKITKSIYVDLGRSRADSTRWRTIHGRFNGKTVIFFRSTFPN